jgi:hypothetical protein
MGPSRNRLDPPRGKLTRDCAGTADQVARWRAQRMSWTAIARALGRGEPAVRREFDPQWSGR